MKRFFAIVGMSLVVLLSGFAFAGAATDTVKSKQKALFDVIAKPESAARNKKLKSLFDGILNYDQFSKDSLGKKWSTLSSDQQVAFSGRLTTLVRCNYKKNLKKILDFDIVYAGEESKRGATLVKTRAQHKSNDSEPEIEIDFLMKNNKAIDIYTERASLTRTYRSQFLRILKKDGGFKKLIAKMDKKIAKDGCD